MSTWSTLVGLAPSFTLTLFPYLPCFSPAHRSTAFCCNALAAQPAGEEYFIVNRSSSSGGGGGGASPAETDALSRISLVQLLPDLLTFADFAVPLPDGVLSGPIPSRSSSIARLLHSATALSDNDNDATGTIGDGALSKQQQLMLSMVLLKEHFKSSKRQLEVDKDIAEILFELTDATLAPSFAVGGSESSKRRLLWNRIAGELLSKLDSASTNWALHRALNISI